MNWGIINLRKASLILLVFLFVSCEGMFNEEEELNNAQDQAKIDQLATDISKENYSTRVSGITAVYGNRIKAIGLDAGTSDQILNQAFEVWPKKSRLDKFELQNELNNRLRSYRAEAKQVAAKGVKTSAFDVMLQSEEADTVFSEVEKSFLRDARGVFDAEGKTFDAYISELEQLAETYRVENDLTDKEFVTIMGVSESVGTFMKVLHENRDQLASMYKMSQVNQAGILTLPSLLLLQSGGDDDVPRVGEKYTDEDCSFNVNWTEVGGSATMGAALGMLGFTSRLAWWAATTPVFGPGSVVGAASDFAASGVLGAGAGAFNEISDQYGEYGIYIQNAEKCK